KAGVGSAMNDVNRQVAGALGVAVIGSLASSLYSAKVDPATAALPHPAAQTATDSIGGAAPAAPHPPASAGDALSAAAHGAFTDAIGVALLVGTGVMLAAAVFVKRYLPDLRGTTTTAAGFADDSAAPARAPMHTAPALEAPASPR